MRRWAFRKMKPHKDEPPLPPPPLIVQRYWMQGLSMKYGVLVVLLIASATAQDKLTVSSAALIWTNGGRCSRQRMRRQNVKATVGRIGRLSTRSERYSP